MTEEIDRLITIRETCERLSWARTTIYATLKRDPSLPRPIKLSSGATRFSLRELAAWIAARSRGVSAVRNPEFIALTPAEKAAHRASKVAGPRASASEAGGAPGTSLE